MNSLLITTIYTLLNMTLRISIIDKRVNIDAVLDIVCIRIFVDLSAF